MLSRTCGRATMPATDSSPAHTNQIPPKIATGMPAHRAETALVDLRAAHGGVDVAEAGVEGIVEELVMDVGGRDRGAEADQREGEHERAASFVIGMYEL